MKRIYYVTMIALGVMVLATGCKKDNLTEPDITKPDIVVSNDKEITESFTDPVFRKYILDNFCAGRETIMLSDVENSKRVIDVSGLGVTSLAGIEHFASLTTLSCSGNKIESLELSLCKALTSLTCSDNELKSLVLSGCNVLEHLDCSSNKLEVLDLSGCTALWYLDCCNNQLAKPDVDSCKALEHLKYDIEKPAALDNESN